MKIENSWWVYIVKCGDESLYTGITTQLDRRLEQHNGLRSGGARYTAARRPVSLVYAEQSDDRSTASKREYQLKQLSKKEKQTLVHTYSQETLHGSETVKT